jgi:putative aldouronate transport system substrate-binding protein
MSAKRITRRQALKGLGVAAAGALLAACQPKIVTETVVVPGATKIVEKVVTATPVPVVLKTPEIWVTGAGLCAGGGNAQKNAALQKAILDQTGVKVNGVLLPDGPAGTEKLNLLFASGQQPLDMCTVDWQAYKGSLTPLGDLLQQYGKNILKVSEPLALKKMKDAEGTTWGYPRGETHGITGRPYMRGDWLAQLNLQVPTTWDEMENVIAAMRKAHPESVVFPEGRANLMQATLGAFVETGNGNWIDPADKAIKPVEIHPGYRDWIERMSQWWQKGWFHKEGFATIDLPTVLKSLTVGTWLGWYSRITYTWENIRLQGSYPTEDFVTVPKVTGPKGLARTNTPANTSAWVVLRKSKYPDACIKYADWQYAGLPDDPTNFITAVWGIEKVDWEWVDKAKRIYRAIVPSSTKCEDKYARDYCVSLGLPETMCAPIGANGQLDRHYGWLMTSWNDFDTAKMPIDADVPYDMTVVTKKAPKSADLSRLFNEETIKFITGARPLSEWSAFQKQAEDAGLKEWSQAMTDQYRAVHPA